MDENRKILLIDASYSILGYVSWQTAAMYLWTGKADGVPSAEPSMHIRTVHGTFEIPAVIALYTMTPFYRRRVSRRGVIQRDGFLCRYCGEKGSAKTLSVDHVVPKSRGGSFTWENLVCACRSCNIKKADRTPEEAGMSLLSKPRDAFSHRQYFTDEPSTKH